MDKAMDKVHVVTYGPQRSVMLEVRVFSLQRHATYTTAHTRCKDSERLETFEQDSEKVTASSHRENATIEHLNIERYDTLYDDKQVIQRYGSQNAYLCIFAIIDSHCKNRGIVHEHIYRRSEK